MDDDENKQLSPEELAAGLSEVGFDIGEDEIAELFTKLDEDGSGGVDLTEFIKALRVSRFRCFACPRLFSAMKFEYFTLKNPHIRTNFSCSLP